MLDIAERLLLTSAALSGQPASALASWLLDLVTGGTVGSAESQTPWNNLLTKVL
jgi:hypothetical protein